MSPQAAHLARAFLPRPEAPRHPKGRHHGARTAPCTACAIRQMATALAVHRALRVSAFADLKSNWRRTGPAYRLLDWAGAQRDTALRLASRTGQDAVQINSDVGDGW